MISNPKPDQVCLVIGASHAGVNFAFALRREGWQGKIVLFDSDPLLPYHRPPLSKTYLVGGDQPKIDALKAEKSYEKNNITLRLGTKVTSIDRHEKSITLQDGTVQPYDKLLLATGARPLVPAIPGIDTAGYLYTLRTAADAQKIRKRFQDSKEQRVVVIGGGYIGLETAASLRKIGAKVTVLEREDRILARVTAPYLSSFFQKLHTDNGVVVLTGKNVTSIENDGDYDCVYCADGTRFEADMIVLGVGVRVNDELALAADLTTEDGICVDGGTRTSDPNVFAIGDCTYHHNLHYDRTIRLESVQNAVDQAKVAAAVICGKQATYDAIPWFWSDQYDVKLQMVGLSTGYDQALIREETGGEPRFSVWYFAGDRLLAVDAVNHAKAYVLGTKFIKGGQKLDKSKLIDPNLPLRPGDLLRG